MVENFYKITKAQAETLGKFIYSPGEGFDPFCNEQKDGMFLVSEKMYLKLKELSQIKKIDFTKLSLIEKTSINTKVFVIQK